MLSVYPDKSRPLLPMGFKQGEQQQQWKLLEHKKALEMQEYGEN